MDRRYFSYPRIVLGEHEVVWSRSIKYRRVHLDRRLSFSEHLQIAINKAIQCGADLARLMPNIGGPKKAKRRLVASVVHSKWLFYVARVWTSALDNHAIQKILSSAQRCSAMRIISAYRTVSKNAALILASVPPIDLLVAGRQEAFLLRKEHTCLNNEQEIARVMEAIRKDARRKLVKRWLTR